MMYFWNAIARNLESDVQNANESEIRVFDISTCHFWAAKEGRCYDANENIGDEESFYFYDLNNDEIDENTMEKIIK